MTSVRSIEVVSNDRLPMLMSAFRIETSLAANRLSYFCQVLDLPLFPHDCHMRLAMEMPTQFHQPHCTMLLISPWVGGGGGGGDLRSARLSLILLQC